MVKLIVTILLGWAGIHKFMEKKYLLGIIYLLTFGLFGLGWLFDVVKEIVKFVNSNKETLENNYSFNVAGTSYNTNNIASLLKKSNPEYSDFIYRVLDCDATLVKEPTNTHDKNAIMVLIKDTKVGYVPASDNVEIGKLMDSGRIKSVKSTITGGPVRRNDVIEDKDFSINVVIEV